MRHVALGKLPQVRRLRFARSFESPVAHLLPVSPVFHQVHLAIAAFPHDPDEDVTVHLPSGLFISVRDAEVTRHPRRDSACFPAHNRAARTTKVCLSGRWKLYRKKIGFCKFRKSARQFFVTRQLTTTVRRRSNRRGTTAVTRHSDTYCPHAELSASVRCGLKGKKDHLQQEKYFSRIGYIGNTTY